MLINKNWDDKWLIYCKIYNVDVTSDLRSAWINWLDGLKLEYEKKYNKKVMYNQKDFNNWVIGKYGEGETEGDKNEHR